MATASTTNAISRPPAAIRSVGEEIVNAVTHGIGCGLSVAGLSLMAAFAASTGSAWHMVSCVIFGAALVNLYLVSTLYHSIRAARAKRLFRVLDHISIYLLIAGTYTAISLTFLRGPLGWTLFGLEWGLAVTGIVLKVTLGFKYDCLAVAGYVIMGWLILMAAGPILNGFPRAGLLWLVLGGLCYTGGVPFYLMDEKFPYFHGVWHLFVLAGSICHFFAVLWYIIPQA